MHTYIRILIFAVDNCSFAYHCSKSTEKKRKHDHLDLPDGSGWGDHIQLLQIYECWHQTYYDIDWCKDRGLQVPSFNCIKNLLYGEILMNYIQGI